MTEEKWRNASRELPQESKEFIHVLLLSVYGCQVLALRQNELNPAVVTRVQIGYTGVWAFQNSVCAYRSTSLRSSLITFRIRSLAYGSFSTSLEGFTGRKPGLCLPSGGFPLVTRWLLKGCEREVVSCQERPHSHNTSTISCHGSLGHIRKHTKDVPKLMSHRKTRVRTCGRHPVCYFSFLGRPFTRPK